LFFNQSVNDPQKDLAKFGYKLNIEILEKRKKEKKNPFCIFFGYQL
jgi:hypothetical protein